MNRILVVIRMLRVPPIECYFILLFKGRSQADKFRGVYSFKKRNSITFLISGDTCEEGGVLAYIMWLFVVSSSPRHWGCKDGAKKLVDGMRVWSNRTTFSGNICKTFATIYKQTVDGKCWKQSIFSPGKSFPNLMTFNFIYTYLVFVPGCLNVLMVCNQSQEI